MDWWLCFDFQLFPKLLSTPFTLPLQPPLSPQVMLLGKRLTSCLLNTFSQPELAAAASQDTLVETERDVMTLLQDERILRLEDVAQLNRSFNFLMLKVIENGEKNALFGYVRLSVHLSVCVCACVLACLYGIKKKGSIVKLVTVCMYAFLSTHPTLHVRVCIGHTADALSDLLALLTLPSSSLLHVMLESLGQDGNPSKLTEMAMKVST